jgi:hypothetical protein
MAYTVNLLQPAIPYARLFSYTTPDFLSENRELVRAMRTIRTVIPERAVCLLTDSLLGDQKTFAWAEQYHLELITHATSDRGSRYAMSAWAAGNGKSQWTSFPPPQDGYSPKPVSPVKGN